jgi:hypothetical protein
MSLAAILASASASAQRTLAELGGAASGAKNSLYRGRAYLGVYGPPEVERVLLPAGGERVRQWVAVTTTRAQFTTAPATGQKWVRTDLAPAHTYTIDHVNDQDATIYTLRLVRVVS